MSGLTLSLGTRQRRRRRFVPTQDSALKGWLRLAASDKSGGEWTPSIVDVLNPGNPVTQVDTDRRCAVGSSANGLPTMVFDGTDVHVWPFSPTINNMTTKLGFWFWWKPVNVAGSARILYLAIGTGAATGFHKLDISTNGDDLLVDVYITNVNGRRATYANVLTAGAWQGLYIQYDSSRGGDANLNTYRDKVLLTPAWSSFGAGGTLGLLQSPGGNMLLGAVSNTDTPAAAQEEGSEFGPNMFVFGDNLTAQQIANYYDFERPT